MNASFRLLLALIFLAGCKDKKEEGPDNSAFIPVTSIIQSQVKDVDTSLYSIIKVETVNNQAETTFIKREDFRKYAADFLALPDLRDKKWKGDYDETNFYDDALESIILSYTAKDEDLETRKQELLVDPNPEGNSKVNTIIAETISDKKGEHIKKNMIWHIDQRFQVITTRVKKNGEEEVKKLQVIWK